ncbi:two-component sensor histidine kinase [Microbacterium sp. 4R-513]|uniref:sensor histidine kinase n=1 Tax=Microbacterium sp. 4R-513 TaxID=2567934 RepID=UPI0013E18929|nr:ATP-binding protein [Microbacterium sp. 4R-513]QIG39051.1 two-component sensor histidine kinase [Microbacterium sp. 4R-513]
MNVPLDAVLSSAAVAAVVGVAGAVVILALARRRVVVAALAAPLVVVLSVTAGVVVGAGSMLLTADDLTGILLVLLATVPVALAVGALVAARIQAASRDAERAAAAAESQRRIEGQRRDLVAWVSHDLRTPLAGIRATAEALQDGVLTDAAAAAGSIGRDAMRMSGMVDDLLTLSRLQAPSVALERTEVDLGDLVSDAVAALRSLAEAAGVQLTGQAPTGVRAVVAASELRRAVGNLVMNGIRHTPQGGTVDTTLAVAGDSAVVSVADGCGGIAEADLPHVFETGWRGSAARAGDAGAGLGLAIVREVAEAHHGSATVRNGTGGCVFEIGLPLPG